MSKVTFDTEDFELTKATNALNNLGQTHINDLAEEEAELIRKTQSQLPNIHVDTPRSTDTSLQGRITSVNGSDSAMNEIYSALDNHVNTLQNAVQNPDVLEFPNLAWEAIQAGLLKEKITNDQINAHINEAEKIQKDIDLLLDLSAELSLCKEEDNELSEKALSILDQLKTRGVDLKVGEDEKVISKDRIAEIKSLAGSQTDKLRSNLQIIFTTKIQTLIQNIGSIMEILKDISRNNSRLINSINSKMAGR